MPTNDKARDALAREVEGVKRLLILMLLRGGASQAEIARALGVTQPSISRMFPSGIGKLAKRTPPTS
jgi:predicted XRE-type DNA-binding protein